MKHITKSRAILIFLSFTIYFSILIYSFYPFIVRILEVNPALYWFFTGYLLFIPIFISALLLVWKEGNKTLKDICFSLKIKRMNKQDIRYSIYGLIAVFIFTGLVYLISNLVFSYFKLPPLATQPWFINIEVFYGYERLFLLIWLPMFFFNIVGEEILWRGYIQSRLTGKHSWLLCSILWLIFHIPFGIDLLIMLIPVVLIIPYIFHKTQNSVNGILIHGLFNGPTFILIALGIIN